MTNTTTSSPRPKSKASPAQSPARDNSNRNAQRTSKASVDAQPNVNSNDTNRNPTTPLHQVATRSKRKRGGISIVSESYSSSTITQQGLPAVHESRHEYKDSMGKAVSKHVRKLGEQKLTLEWTREKSGAPKRLRKSVQDAAADAFEAAWTERLATLEGAEQITAASIEDDKTEVGKGEGASTLAVHGEKLALDAPSTATNNADNDEAKIDEDDEKTRHGDNETETSSHHHVVREEVGNKKRRQEADEDQDAEEVEYLGSASATPTSSPTRAKTVVVETHPFFPTRRNNPFAWPRTWAPQPRRRSVSWFSSTQPEDWLFSSLW